RRRLRRRHARNEADRRSARHAARARRRRNARRSRARRPPQIAFTRKRFSAPHRKGASRMIDSIVKAGWMNLRRDRAALVLSFIVPIVFFSIFATVFGQRDSGTAKINLAVADEDHSERSKELIAGLKSETALTI